VTQQIDVRVERTGRLPVVQNWQSVDSVVGAVIALDGEHDVTVVITPGGSDARLLVAIDGSKAFLGIERPDGIFQFAHSNPTGMTLPFTIGGQASDIDTRYLLDLKTAATVVGEGLTVGEQSSVGLWERQ
jgi:hypothetical protein